MEIHTNFVDAFDLLRCAFDFIASFCVLEGSYDFLILNCERPEFLLIKPQKSLWLAQISFSAMRF